MHSRGYRHFWLSDLNVVDIFFCGSAAGNNSPAAVARASPTASHWLSGEVRRDVITARGRGFVMSEDGGVEFRDAKDSVAEMPFRV